MVHKKNKTVQNSVTFVSKRAIHVCSGSRIRPMASVVQTRGRLAAARAVPTTVLAPLPCWFVHDVLLLLPVDTRLRCVELNRAWRALLADTRFWTRLNLTASGGVTRFSFGLLRAAVAKARGQLRALEAPCSVGYMRTILYDTLCHNVDTLTELRLHLNGLYDEPANYLFLLERFGRLECLEVTNTVDLRNTVQDGLFLKKAPPYGALRVQQLNVWANEPYGPTFFPDLSQHTSLKELLLYNFSFTTADESRAFVDVAIKLKLEVVKLYLTNFTWLLLKELTRLVSAGEIRKLVIGSVVGDATLPFEDAASTTAFCDAVQASKMRRLVFVRVPVPLEVEAVIIAVRERRLNLEDLF